MNSEFKPGDMVTVKPHPYMTGGRGDRIPAPIAAGTICRVLQERDVDGDVLVNFTCNDRPCEMYVNAECLERVSQTEPRPVAGERRVTVELPVIEADSPLHHLLIANMAAAGAALAALGFSCSGLLDELDKLQKRGLGDE